jgi:hydroxyacylglutathione hydrolase
MIVKHFLSTVNEANMFIIGCEETQEAMLIDAGAFDPPIAQFVDSSGWQLVKVFITHDHYDHTDGLPEIVRRYAPEVIAHKTKVGRFRLAGKVKTTGVSHGDEVAAGRLRGRVFATPGHTPDGLSLAFDGLCFTGDALFAGSVGGTASEEQARTQIEHIRKHIFTLPPETELHVGHGPSSTVAVESRYNPFFI